MDRLASQLLRASIELYLFRYVWISSLFFFYKYIHIYIYKYQQTKKSTLRYNIWLVAAAFSRLCSTFVHQTTTTTVITKQNQDRTEPWHTKTPSLTTTREQQVPITNLFLPIPTTRKAKHTPIARNYCCFFFVFLLLFFLSLVLPLLENLVIA